VDQTSAAAREADPVAPAAQTGGASPPDASPVPMMPAADAVQPTTAPLAGTPPAVPVASQPLSPVLPPPPGAAPPPTSAPDLSATFASLQSHGSAVLGRLDPTGWRPTLIVAGILAAIVFGTMILNAAIPAPRPGGPDPGPVQPGGGVPVGGGVVVHPVAGWSVVQQGEGRVVLQKGAVAFDVRTARGAGDPTALLNAYVEQALRPDATQLGVTPPEVVPVAAGTPGARATYVGTFRSVSGPLEGQLTTVVLRGSPLIFDAYAPPGQLQSGLGEVAQMIQTIQVP
jgi:hypothetical protein